MADALADELPRISVDTLDDWERVQASFDSALETALATVLAQASDKDALRQHMQAWRDATFEAVKPNLRVNGHNFETYEAESATEPFDEALDRNIWALDAERTAWDKTLSDRRRTAPLEVETLVQQMLSKQSTDEQDDEDEIVDDVYIDGDDPLDDERQQDALETHQAVHGSVRELSQDIPELLRKKQLVDAAAQSILTPPYT